jgi:hypothetical protein
MRLLLKAWADGEEGNFALVDITDDLRKWVLDRRELFQMVSSKASDIEALRFFDFSACARFFGEDCNLDPSWKEYDEDGLMPQPYLSEREYSRFDTRECIVVPNDFGNNIIGDAEAEVPNMRYTDYDVIVLGKTGFWLEASDDVGSIHTATVDYDKLLSNFADC